MNRLVWFFLLLLLGLCGPSSSIAFAQAPYQARSNAAGTLRSEQGIPVLEIRGTPESLGQGMGELALAQAKPILEYPRLLAREFSAEYLFPLLLSLGEGMIKDIPAPYMAELKSIHRHSGAPWETLVAGNTMFDIKKFVLCSGLALAPGSSFSQGSVLARNLDYPPVGGISRYSLVTIYHPEGKRSFVSVGFPGLVGVLSGMNDAGLALAIHEVIDLKTGLKRVDLKGVPYAMCYRTILEECSTIDEAIARLEKFRRTCTTNLLIADRKGVAVLEITPELVRKRPPHKGVVCCANHFCLDELKPEKPLNPLYSMQRQKYLENQSNQGLFKVEEITEHLNKVRLGKQTLQSVVFDTEALDMWVSFSGPPSSEGPFARISLKERLCAGRAKATEPVGIPPLKSPAATGGTINP